MSSPLSSVQAARIALATRLRDMRLDAGLAGHELSIACGWHPAKTSRIEHAKAAPTDADLHAWCQACGAPDQAPDLVAAARSADSMYVQWKRLNRAGLRHLQEEVVPLFERTRSFRVYCSNVVPGLLQTESYARAVLSAYGTFHQTATDVDEAAAARVARSHVIRDGRHRFALLVEESVLRSGIAPASTTAEQLGNLLEVMTFPWVSFGILPIGSERPLWTLESFTIYDGTQVGIELLSARVTLTSPGEISLYAKAFGELAGRAVYGASARSLITAAIDTLG
ncbi:helix-turn-helix domain-containing protein [Streptomyces goshikiensis]|uniref:helix-turn-helix domain-containing protein n=1 Tax=Streptomyces goshikiensis TaxID=1942 RepID=UPI00371770A5